MNIIKFNSDTKYRKQWFTGIHFSHPAKMHLSLQMWLIDNFTKEGETILDPMAGCGTILVGCSMGRNVICLELEDKFIQMQKGNWEKIQQRGCQLGYSMGTATILQGDARDLSGLLVDKCIFSPPFAETLTRKSDKNKLNPLNTNKGTTRGRGYDSFGELTYKNYVPSQRNIGNLPYGEIDKIITSPPYAEAQEGAGIAKRGYQGSKHSPTDLVGKRSYMPEQAGQSDGQLSNLPYGSIDAVISSPPYSDSPIGGGLNTKPPREGHNDQTGRSPVSPSQSGAGKYNQVDAVISSPPYENVEKIGREYGGIVARESAKGTTGNLGIAQIYSRNKENIGNLKGDTYLSAMLQVYQQCHSVLKDGGLMILVTKNFIRNKKQIRLDLDTIKLCEQAGFTFQDRWYRELASQSFWRTIYHQKYPDVEPIKYEDILVFKKLEVT